MTSARHAFVNTPEADRLYAKRLRGKQKLYSVGGSPSCELARGHARTGILLRTLLVVAPTKEKALARARAVHARGGLKKRLGVPRAAKCRLNLSAEEL